MRAIKAWSVGLGAWSLMMLGVFGQTAADPGEGLCIDLAGMPGIRAVKWWGKVGRTYFVQSNPTLNPNTWSYMPVVETGADAVHSWNLSTTGERMFVRLVYTDQLYSGSASTADFDGDGLTNAQEVASSGPRSNPLNEDTDDDGFSDSVEWDNGYNPLLGTSNPDYYGNAFTLRASRVSFQARHIISPPGNGGTTYYLSKTYWHLPGFTTQPGQYFPTPPDMPALPPVPGLNTLEDFNPWAYFDPDSENPLASTRILAQW